MRMAEWLNRLSERGVLISDGAWGTQLAERGLTTGVAPEAWNADNPDAVRAVARAYVDAGSDIILTNTFGGSPLKLEKAGLGERVAELNRLGVELSKEAAGEAVLVFASLGPTGEFMQPLGTITEAEMVAGFSRQVQAFLEGGADGVVIETMTDLGEARAALRAVRENSDLPAVVSMTFDKGVKGYATMMGVRPEQAAAELDGAGADAVGANCGSGIEDVTEVTRLMRTATVNPLWAKPNAGLPELVGGETVFRETPEQMAARLGGLVEAGAGIVGGCCGTTPAHVAALVKARGKLDLG
jgi:5-methyltetrahydrofolate--homocysteine methyltransferase